MLVPALATPVGWTGDADNCTVGSESAASKQATISAVNFMRQLAGLKPVKLNATYSAKAQAAALVFAAEGQLSHSIPSSWDCYSAAAAEAAAKSNIAWSSDSSFGGSNAIVGYMDDAGTGNTAVGHRRWILNPRAKSMGTGSTDNTNALWILDSGATSSAIPKKNPQWVEWPAAGYFPSQLEPDGRWSLSGDNSGTYSFSRATVIVKDSSGRKLGVKTYPQQANIGNDTLVFEVAGVIAPTETKAAKTYKVTVKGIKQRGVKKSISHGYSVRLFDPTA